MTSAYERGAKLSAAPLSSRLPCWSRWQRLMYLTTKARCASTLAIERSTKCASFPHELIFRPIVIIGFGSIGKGSLPLMPAPHYYAPSVNME